MTEKQNYSDEFLSAFIDNELTPEEQAQFHTHLSQDDLLKRQVCELRNIRDLVSMAYKKVPMPERAITTGTVGWKYHTGLAAGVALLLGVISGWFLNETQGRQPQVLASAPTANEDSAKALFHVGDSNPEHHKFVLDEVESLLKFYRQTNQRARVEVITNGGGLSLLMVGLSPFSERIHRMQQEYGDLTFVACQNTIERVKRETGLQAKLLPGVVVIDSGVALIMRRQLQGWAYLQV